MSIQIIVFTVVTGLAIFTQYLINKVNDLQFKLDIKNTENKNLIRVLYENDLLPKEMVK